MPQTLSADERIVRADSVSTGLEFSSNLSGEPGIVFIKIQNPDSPSKKCL